MNRLTFPPILSRTLGNSNNAAADDPQNHHQPLTTMPCAKELKRYASKMVQFMLWRDDFAYPKDHVFTDDQRDSVKPKDILAYMTFVAYVKVDINKDNRPTQARGNALKTIKRSISCFMQRKSKWEPINKRGNPTRHHTINNFLKQVERF